MITKSGSMLGWLEEDDIVGFNIENPDPESETKASTEAIVHKEVFKNTDAKAIIHSHNLFCTILSFILNEIN